MNATVQSPEPCRRTLEVTVPAEEVEREIREASRRFARSVSIPGFRRGHAPAPVVLQRYRKEIESEVAERLAEQHVWQVIEEHRLVPLHRPLVEEVRLQAGEPLTIRASFEVRPEFTLGPYKGLGATRRPPQVEEARVERHLRAIQEEHARLEAVDRTVLEDGDVAVVDMQPVGAGGEPMGEPRRGMHLHLGEGGAPEEIREQLRGLEVGQERQVAFPPAGGGGGQPDAAAEPSRYRLALLAIRRRVLPELGDDLAREAAGAESLEDLRGRLRRDLERLAEERADRDVREELLGQLVKAHVFPVPELLVEQELDHLLRSLAESMLMQGLDPSRPPFSWDEKRTELRPAADRRVRADLILDAIAAAEELQVEEGEIQEVLSREARRQRTTAAALRATLEKDGRLNALKTKLLRDRSLDLVVRSANIIGRVGDLGG